MLKNYLTVALRNLWKNRFYTLLNILGLALGMACCLLIMVHVRTELSYDRFHDRAEDIYRVAMHAQTQNDRTDYPGVGYPLARMLQETSPQVEAAVRFFNIQECIVALEEEQYEEQHLIFADSTYSQLFKLEFLAGDPQRALMGPGEVILTESAAKRYFGEADPLQQLLRLSSGGIQAEARVVGVVRDYPGHSHFHFDLLASMRTFMRAIGGPRRPLFNTMGIVSFYTYIKTTNPEAVESQLTTLYETRVDEQAREFVKGYFLQPLTDIHLHSNLINELETNGNALFIKLFIFVGLLTLIIACINFINLTTALAANRSKEVGLRKVVGATRPILIRQFLSESAVLTVLALALSVLVAELLRLAIQMTGIYIHVDYLGDAFVWLLLSAIALFVGLAAGSYPAFYLSRFRPIQVLRGTLSTGAKSGALRKVLVAFQFVLSTAMIIGTLIFLKQLNYIRSMDMGFDHDWRVVVPIGFFNEPGRQVRVAEGLKQTFGQYPGIVNATATNSVPGSPRGLPQVQVEGQPAEKLHRPATLGVDFDYVKTMGLEILDGRDFDPGYGTDSTQALLINETAIRELELSAPVIGTGITYVQNNFGQALGDGKARVVGVFRDMHFEPVYREIYPMILRILPNQYTNLIVHIRPENKEATLVFMEERWSDFVPEKKFSYTFLDDELAAIYQKETQLGRLVTLFAVLAIFIACLGLFGLSAFTTLQRRRETSIRKMLGASVSNIVGLLSREFLYLVLIAFPLGAGLAWWGTRFWLQSFAYRASIGPEVYAVAGFITISIAFLTVSYHSFRAASANPVDALHRE